MITSSQNSLHNKLYYIYLPFMLNSSINYHLIYKLTGIRMVYLELSKLTTRSFQVLQVHEHRHRSSAERQDRIILHISHGKPVLSPGRTLLPISGFTLGIDILCFHLYYLCIWISSSNGQGIGDRLSKCFFVLHIRFQNRRNVYSLQGDRKLPVAIRNEISCGIFRKGILAAVLFGRQIQMCGFNYFFINISIFRVKLSPKNNFCMYK